MYRSHIPIVAVSYVFPLFAYNGSNMFRTFTSFLQVPSHVLMGIPQGGEVVSLTALGEACLRMDLTAIHEILEKLGYKDDEGAATEVLFLI